MSENWTHFTDRCELYSTIKYVIETELRTIYKLKYEKVYFGSGTISV